MRKALGLMEVLGFTCAVYIADIMVKTANIEVDYVKITNGLGYVMVVISGDVGAVNAAIHAGEIAACNQQSFISSRVIARPIEGIHTNINNDEKVNKKENAIEKSNEHSIKDTNSEMKIDISETKSKLSNEVISTETVTKKDSIKKQREKKNLGKTKKSKRQKMTETNKINKKTEE